MCEICGLGVLALTVVWGPSEYLQYSVALNHWPKEREHSGGGEFLMEWCHMRVLILKLRQRSAYSSAKTILRSTRQRDAIEELRRILIDHLDQAN